MKKYFLLLSVLLLHINFVYAVSYIVVDGGVYYMNNSSEEVYAVFLDSIYSEDTYIRMSPECQTFTILNTQTNKYYQREAPTKWPGIKLKDCIAGPEPDIRHIAKNRGIKGNFNADPSRSSQFHYLCVFANEFIDSKWDSYDDNDKVVSEMQKALYNIGNKQNIRSGKQFIITPSNATRSNIISHLDTIFRQTADGDVVFMYLSSHGDYDASGNFNFIVKDSRYDEATKQIKNAFSKENINNYVNLLTAKNVSVWLFVDACNAGDLAYNDGVNGKAVYYLSTRKKANAYTDKSGSYFARALMDAMNGIANNDAHYFSDGIIDVGALGQYLEFSVYKYSNHHQHPLWEPHDFQISEILWRNQFRESNEVIKNKEIVYDIKNSTLPKIAEAMVALGDAYLLGEDINKERTIKSIDSAFLWYSRAERLAKIDKNTRSKVYYGLFNCYREMKNPTTAVRNLQIASTTNKKAMYDLGICYIDGYGVSKDYKNAIKLIKKSAKGKDACSESQWYLGFLYHQRAIAASYDILNTNYILRNENKEIKFTEMFKQAFYYTEILGEGFEVKYDKNGKKIFYSYFSSSSFNEYMKESVKWYTKAVKNGNTQAKLELGKLYYEGIYIDKNQKKGLQLIREAAQSNHKDAIMYLDKVSKK